MEYPNNDLKVSIVFPLYLCSKEVIRKYSDYLKEFDLTYTQYLVLMYFIGEKQSNLKRIGKKGNIYHSNTTIDSLAFSKTDFAASSSSLTYNTFTYVIVSICLS